MVFENLIKLNSHIAEGFIMNDIVSLFREKEKEINDKEIDILKKAKKFIHFIKDGQTYISNNSEVNDLEKSLEAYSISLKALKESDECINLEKFNNIIKNSENQINNAIRNKIIHSSEADDTFKLFFHLRNLVLKKANKLNCTYESLII